MRAAPSQSVQRRDQFIECVLLSESRLGINREPPILRPSLACGRRQSRYHRWRCQSGVVRRPPVRRHKAQGPIAAWTLAESDRRSVDFQLLLRDTHRDIATSIPGGRPEGGLFQAEPTTSVSPGSMKRVLVELLRDRGRQQQFRMPGLLDDLIAWLANAFVTFDLAVVMRQSHEGNTGSRGLNL